MYICTVCTVNTPGFQIFCFLTRALSSRMITPYSYGPTTEEIEAVAASVELTKEELYELEAEQFSLQDISTTSSGRKKRSRKLSTGSNSSNGQSSDSETDNRASQYVEEAEAEIDILEDLEQLNVKTTNDAYDDDDDSAFIIIESKSGAKDNVIESFFNDPKKFTKSPPRLQSSAVDSSSSSFKKFNKLSQKERKKQQKQQHSKLYYIYIFKTRTKNSFGVLNQLLHGFFCTSYIHFFHLLIVKF